MVKISGLYRIIGVIVTTALVVVGVMYVWHLSVVTSMRQKQENISDEYKKLTDSLQSRDEIIGYLNDRIARLEEAQQRSPDEAPRDLLRIYTYNANADVEGVGFYVAAPEHCSLDQKLELVADILVKYRFKRGIIELKGIEEKGSKKIAIIELRETKEDSVAWRGGYFQGSTGGHATTFILVNTFLQPDYAGQWIDGVEFYYDGKPITADWDHIFLNGIKYRK